MALRLIVNGVEREITTLEHGAPLGDVVAALNLKADRVAIERNGEIAPRRNWAETEIRSGDRLEVVHFVGGGRAAPGWYSQ